MDFFEVIQQRHSVRDYLNTPVEAEKLQRIFEAANRAPSAGNLQAYEIYLVTEPAQRKALARAALNQDFIAQAPVVLVFCAHPARSEWKYRQRGVRLYAIQDATIACTFAMLAATALGLGNVWVGAFDDVAVQQAINIPSHLLPVAILPIGYPTRQEEPSQRRSLADLVHTVGG